MTSECGYTKVTFFLDINLKDLFLLNNIYQKHVVIDISWLFSYCVGPLFSYLLCGPFFQKKTYEIEY